jgi:hypothetical protein
MKNLSIKAGLNREKSGKGVAFQTSSYDPNMSNCGLRGESYL